MLGFCQVVSDAARFSSNCVCVCVRVSVCVLMGTEADMRNIRNKADAGKHSQNSTDNHNDSFSVA